MERGLAEEGTQLLFRNELSQELQEGEGLFYPTCAVKVDKDSDSLFLKEEVFGPVFTVIESSSDEESIEIANNTEYGLGAVIVGTDTEQAKVYAKKIQAGMVGINAPCGSTWKLPFGGEKASGMGRESGI